MEQDHLTKLQEAFDRRQRVMDQATREIAELLTPTLLTAVFELMELQHEDVIWEDFVLQDNVLVIKVQVHHSPLENSSAFLSALIPPDDSANVTHRLIFGVPLDVVFHDKDDLKRWCLEVVQRQADSSVSEEQVQQLPPLTEDQLLQVLHFQQIYTTEQ